MSATDTTDLDVVDRLNRYARATTDCMPDGPPDEHGYRPVVTASTLMEEAADVIRFLREDLAENERRALVELEQLMTDAWRHYDPGFLGYDEEGDPIGPYVDDRPLPDDWRSFDAPEPWRTVSEFLRRKGVAR